MAGCPCCGSDDTGHIVQTPPMPVNPCVLVQSAAVSCKAVRRAIDLHGCNDCGFLWNASFDETLVTYDRSYEGTQSYSAHFQRYLRQTALAWRDQLGGDVPSLLEVGCGQGEFLDVLAETTDARLVGYDPAYRNGNLIRAMIRAESLPASPTEKFGAVINRMTLEHIADPASFVSGMAGWVAEGGCLVTQVPNAARMITQALYCDLIYEHVNYFNAYAIVQLLERAGFAHNRCQLSYDNQHLTVFSQRAAKTGHREKPGTRQALEAFSPAVAIFADHWNARLAGHHHAGHEIFIWGAGSRATTFINTLREPAVIAGAIDINPRRNGTFIQGTACETYLPEVLRDRSDIKIVVMNPVYRDEISDRLRDLSVTAELLF